MLKDREESGIHSESENKFLIENEKIFNDILKELDTIYENSYAKERLWFYFDLEDQSLLKSSSSISLRPRPDISGENANYMLTFKISSETNSIKHRVEFDAEFEAVNTSDPEIIRKIVFSFFNELYIHIKNNKEIPQTITFNNNQKIKLSGDISYESFKELIGILELLEIDLTGLLCTCSFIVNSKRWEVYLSQLKNDRIEISCDRINNIVYYSHENGNLVGNSQLDRSIYELEVDQSSSHRRTEKQGSIKEHFLNFTDNMKNLIKTKQGVMELDKNKYQRVMELKNK